MGVRLLLSCGGCDATAEGTALLRKLFYGTRGDHGIGSYHIGNPEALAPDGWVMFDPYTQATYCPDCWEVINAEAEDVDQNTGLPRGLPA